MRSMLTTCMLLSMDRDCCLAAMIELEELIEQLLTKLSATMSMLEAARVAHDGLKSILAESVPIVFLDRLPKSRLGRAFSCQLAGCFLQALLPFHDPALLIGSSHDDKTDPIYSVLDTFLDAALIKPNGIKGGYFVVQDTSLYHLYLLVYLSQFMVLSLSPHYVSHEGMGL